MRFCKSIFLAMATMLLTNTSLANPVSEASDNEPTKEWTAKHPAAKGAKGAQVFVRKVAVTKAAAQPSAHDDSLDLHAAGTLSKAPKKTPTAAASANPEKTVYADNTAATTMADDVNTNIPYESIVPKGAEVVAGDPTKNEFFIVAEDDAKKIKQLVDNTIKPGTIDPSKVKTKAPIVKVTLDQTGAIASMAVMPGMSAAMQDIAKKPATLATGDEVMNIFTKDRMTPIGSRVVAKTVTKSGPDDADTKPMIKLLAMADNKAMVATPTPVMPQAKTVKPAQPKPISLPAINPLLGAKAIAPNAVTLPIAKPAQQIVEHPVEKPVALPLPSKEESPSLEMVLQQVKKIEKEPVKDTKVLAKKVVKPVTKTLVKKAEKTETKTLAKNVKPPVAKATKTLTKNTVKPAKPAVVKTVVVVNGKIKLKVASQDPKAKWSTKHASVPKTKTLAKATNKNNKKHTLTAGVPMDYADYLKKPASKVTTD